MVYLDHAASTPMLPEAIDAMAAQLAVGGNASSLHASGRRTRRAVEESRERLAQALGARPSEVVFTSGGTEADNLAVKGLYWSRSAADPRRRRILASAVEHHAVLDPAEWLARAAGCDGRVAAGRRRRPGLARCPARRDRARPVRRRPGLGDVGQQRGRHRDADRRAGRDRPRVRHSAAHRRGAGRRPAPGRLRRERRRRHDGHRPQARRSGRCRRAAARPHGRRDAGPARRRTGARRPLRHSRQRRRSSASRWPPSSRSRLSPSRPSC